MGNCKFDEETCYKMPFEGAPDAKVVVTHNGPGKYTWVVKAEGAAEEWKLQACDEGMKLCARSLNTGDACSSELHKENLPILGKWKTVSVSGAKEIYKLIGVPAAQAQEIADELVGLCVDETEVFDPVLKEITKNVATKSGNVMNIVTKSSMGVWFTKITVGHTFLVMKGWMKGLECTPCTYIMMRQIH